MSEKISAFTRKYRLPLLIIGALIVAVIPVFNKSSYQRGIITKMMIYATYATSLNVINGFSGQFTLGHAGFMCVGAYTGALLMTKLGVSFWIAFLAGGIAASVFAILVYFPTRKLSGMFLTLVTMAASEIIRLIALNWNSLTNGSKGIKAIPAPVFFGIKLSTKNGGFYYLIFIILIICLFCTSRVLKSRVGRAWIAVRENPIAASSLGVKTGTYKMLNLMYGAFWAGLVGCFQASYMMFIDPTMYTTTETFNILSMTVIGGMGTLVGPIVGSVAINIITEVFRSAEQYRMIIYALILIGMMWIRPQGIAGSSDDSIAGVTPKKKKAVKPVLKEAAK